MKLSKLAAGVFALWPLCAQASGDADTARRFGLIGVWALDCAQPATAYNPYETFAIARDGTIVQSLDSLSIEASDHLHGLSLAGDKLSVKWDSATSKTTLDIVLRKDNGKLQSWSSARPDGTVIVRDGKSVHTGNPMPLFGKCPKR
ncbi:MAG TPA: hypothetical protein VGF56_02440 [Rhizomicrobium sp.]|jgi:hypothetical protein